MRLGGAVSWRPSDRGTRAAHACFTCVGIQLANRSRCRVPRVGEARLACLFALLVGALEFLPRQVDLAADFDGAFRSARQRVRNVLDRADVAVTSSPVVAVAAGRATHQRPSRYCSAMLRPSIFNSATYGTGPVRLVEPAAKPLVERLQFVFVVGVVEAQHRLGVCDRGEAFGGPAAHALSRRIDGDQVGVIALEVLQLVEQRVELGIGDFRVLMRRSSALRSDGSSGVFYPGSGSTGLMVLGSEFWAKDPNLFYRSRARM